MENSIWIDLGKIGQKGEKLKELFRNTHLVELPIDCDAENEIKSGIENTWIVFIDYTLGGSGVHGVRVLTNAFKNEAEFYKLLSHKLINEYVEINKSLDFNKDF
jgi:hypothetical protein